MPQCCIDCVLCLLINSIFFQNIFTVLCICLFNQIIYNTLDLSSHIYSMHKLAFIAPSNILNYAGRMLSKSAISFSHAINY